MNFDIMCDKMLTLKLLKLGRLKKHHPLLKKMKPKPQTFF